MPDALSENTSSQAHEAPPPGKQKRAASFWPGLLLICLQLALILVVISMFQIETDQGLPLILPVIFLGFVTYNLLPIRFRLPFLFFLSLVALTILLGVKDAAIAIAIGLGLILLCHIPIRLSARVVILLMAAGFLAAVRAGWIQTSWGSTAIPAIAAMFMFRLILYLSDLAQKQPESATIWQRLCYFFLLPNSCFFVFPIVDYKTFLRSYDSRDLKISQKGINWMLMGILHLLLYRIIYYYWIPDPSDVVDGSSLAAFFLSSYSVIIRVCGQAYLAVGMVCLFGFDLPPLFQNYFLATGFSDFWRRTYIYWREFLTKIFYYRIFFLLKKLALPVRTVLTLLALFAITWFLHSYQFFWIKGIFPFSVMDGIFWGTFGLMVAINSLFQLKRKNKKNLETPKWTLSSALRNAFLWLSFFSFLCVLFSFWASSSVPEWLYTVAVIGKINPGKIALVPLLFLAAVFMITLAQWLFKQFGDLSSISAGSYRMSFISIVVLVAILGLRVHKNYTSSDSSLGAFMASIQEPRLNKRDANLNQRGYYEPLLEREKFASQFVEAKVIDPKELSKEDALNEEFWGRGKGDGLTGLNQFGMRDREYTPEKPPNTYRFAILGGSIERGKGVRDDQVFEVLVEEQLNRQYGKNQKFEILNFSSSGFDIVRHVENLNKQVVAFQPDAVLYFAHTHLADEERITRNFSYRVNHNAVTFDALEKIQEQAGVEKDMEYYEFTRRFEPFIDQVVDWGLGEIADYCKSHDAVPVWVFLPGFKRESGKEDAPRKRVAQKHGFLTMDLHRVYANHDPDTLIVAAWDGHPNAKGHKLIADALYKEILKNSRLLGLKLQ